jgi:hypothetical protein
MPNVYASSVFVVGVSSLASGKQKEYLVTVRTFVSKSPAGRLDVLSGKLEKTSNYTIESRVETK